MSIKFPVILNPYLTTIEMTIPSIQYQLVYTKEVSLETIRIDFIITPEGKEINRLNRFRDF